MLVMYMYCYSYFRDEETGGEVSKTCSHSWILNKDFNIGLLTRMKSIKLSCFSTSSLVNSESGLPHTISMDILSQIIFSCESCPVCGMLCSSIPGFYPLYTSSTHTPSWGVGIAKCRQGDKITLVENYYSRCNCHPRCRVLALMYMSS